MRTFTMGKITAVCEFESTRSGFRHLATLLCNGCAGHRDVIKMLRASTRNRIAQLDGMSMLTEDEESELESLRLDLRRSYYKTKPVKGHRGNFAP
jgi:hypothetical protein